MHQKNNFYFFLIFLAAPLYLEASPECKNWVAKVASIQGQVDIQHPDTVEWQPANEDDFFCPGDKVRTSKWSRSTLVLNNNAVVTIDQNTTLAFPEEAEEATESASRWFLNLMNGGAFFRSRETQRLNIQTPFINAVHEGTEFMVAVSEQQTEISVFDGQVSGENSQGKIRISKGFKGMADANRPPQLQALKITPEDAVQWTLYYPPIVDYSTSNRSTIIDGLFNPAMTAYQAGDIHQSLIKLETIPDAQRNSHYLTLKAALLLTVGRVDEAQPLIHQAQIIEPNNSDAFALQAVIAVAKNQQQSALGLANKAVNANPVSSIAKIAQSYAFQSQFNIDEASKATQEATRLAPDNALAWARLSELQLSQGDHGAALISAQKAQTLNPKVVRTQTILGFADLAQTKIESATKAFEQALVIDSSDPLARLGLGLAKIRKGDIEAGKNELETAVNLDPNNAVIRSYLGKAYYELRNKDYAGTEFKIAKEMDPKDPTPWFYDAILKQTTNRPVEALHDMQKAIELNDNRGVYRSKLLLDEDRAIRGVSLGRLYNDLGFEDIANQQATKSLMLDPSNYSANRLLSDSYARKPRHEIAQSSALLQSQLLQPININPLQPRLAYTDLNIVKGIGPAEIGLNEYNRAFERNNNRLTATGLYGSNNTLGDETVFSGIQDKFAYSLGQLHYETEGFRANNDIKHDLYNVFTQYEISPQLNVQAEYRHRETTHGHLELNGSYTNFLEKFRRNLEQDSYRLGFKYSPTLHSDLLASFIYANRKESLLNNFDADFDFITHQQQITSKNYQLESQYLIHGGRFNSIFGAGSYLADINNIAKVEIDQLACTQFFSSGLPFLFPCPLQNNVTEVNSSRNQYFGYFYSNINILKNLSGTVGLSFDSFVNRDVNNWLSINQFSPKIGLNWTINKYLSLRLAGFQSVKTGIAVNQILQPVQIAGFNQFFDDINGTRATQYAVGLDTHFQDNLYFGVETYKRDLEEPVGGKFQKREEELYRFYLNWLPHENWAVTSEYRFENYRGGINFVVPNSVETAYVPLNLRFFNALGFFANLGGTYIHQRVKGSLRSEDTSFKSSFLLLDAAIGYKFPKQYGLVSFEAKNLLDKNFKFRDRNFQMNEERSTDIIPERILLARISFNF